MERRIFVGVRKNTHIKRNKKKLLIRVLDYLTSDSYMFAPLISRPPSAFTSSIKKSVTGVKVKKPVIREKKKLLKNVGDYLKSNCYMYAPLLAPPRSIVRSSRYVERVTTTLEVSKRRLILKGYKPNEKMGDLEDQASKGSLPEEIVKQRASVQQGTVEHKETVKLMVHNSCRSSMPGRTVGQNQNVVVN